MANFNAVVKRINKKYTDAGGKEVLYPSDMVPPIRRVSFGSVGADWATYGGLPLGTMVSMCGPSHSGKTLGSWIAIASYRKAFPERTCVFIDVENAIPPMKDFLARVTGVDLNKLFIFNPNGMGASEIFGIVEELEDSDNIGMIVLDSLSSVLSDADFDGDITKDNGMRSSISKKFIEFCKRMLQTLAVRQNIFIFLNHVSANKLQSGAIQYTEPGGRGVEYFPSVKIRFKQRAFIDENGKDILDGTKAAGYKLQFVVTKNRIGPMNREGGFITINLNTGVRKFEDALNVACKFGLIARNGAYYTLTDLDTGEVYKDEDENDLKFKGEGPVLDYLRAHKDFADTYMEMLGKHIEQKQSGSLLDEATVKEIKDQEARVVNV